jgi:hypothetical protein
LLHPYLPLLLAVMLLATATASSACWLALKMHQRKGPGSLLLLAAALQRLQQR